MQVLRLGILNLGPEPEDLLSKHEDYEHPLSISVALPFHKASIDGLILEVWRSGSTPRTWITTTIGTPSG